MKETVTIYTCGTCGREFEDLRVAQWHTILDGHAPHLAERELDTAEYKAWCATRS